MPPIPGQRRGIKRTETSRRGERYDRDSHIHSPQGTRLMSLLAAPPSLRKKVVGQKKRRLTFNAAGGDKKNLKCAARLGNAQNSRESRVVLPAKSSSPLNSS